MILTKRWVIKPFQNLKGKLRTKIMSKVINGKKYMLVDVTFDRDFIYDIYEDEKGNRIKVISGCTR